MVNWVKLTVPPIVTGIGYAIIESMILPELVYAIITIQRIPGI